MPDDPIAPQTPPPPSVDPLVGSPVAPPLTGPTSTGMDPKVAAGIAVLFSFIAGIIFLVIEKRSQYVRFWAMQSTIYGLIWFAVRIVSVILVLMVASSQALSSLVGIVLMLVNLAFFAGAVVMMYYAFTGKEWEFPGIGKFARQQLVKFPPKP